MSCNIYFKYVSFFNLQDLYQCMFSLCHLRGNNKRERFQLDALSPKKDESNKTKPRTTHTTTTGMMHLSVQTIR